MRLFARYFYLFKNSADILKNSRKTRNTISTKKSTNEIYGLRVIGVWLILINWRVELSRFGKCGVELVARS
jgi:hypothetical protein